MAKSTPIQVKLTVVHDESAGIHKTDSLITVPTKAFAKLICDIVEESTRRGMEVGAALMADSLTEGVDDDPEATTKFPGFLGEGTD